MNLPAAVRKHRFAFALSVIIITYLSFGLHHIGQFVTADEHYWLEERIPQYWQAISDHKWKKTYINDKPGVTVALVSGVGLLFEPHPETLCTENKATKILTCRSEDASAVLTAFRLPIVILNTLLLILIAWILRRLLNDRNALITTALIATSPILLGISQIMNPDALLWSTGATAFFTFLLSLKEESRRFALLAGIFLGFAFLSKYTAAIFLPLFFALSAAAPLFRSSEIEKTIDAIRDGFLRLLPLAAGAIATISLFLPAIWDKPAILSHLFLGGEDAFFSWIPIALISVIFADAIFLAGRFLIRPAVRFALSLRLTEYIPRITATLLLVGIAVLLIGRAAFPQWPLFINTPFDEKDLTTSYARIPTPPEQTLLELNPLVYSLAPAILILIITILIVVALGKKDRVIGESRFLFLSASSLIILYLAAFQLSDTLAIPRYLVPLYPAIALLATIALDDLCYRFRTIPRINLLLPGTAIAASLASLVSISPFYLNYANPLLPKDALISHSWGYGGYEAAQYINTLPDSDQLLIWSDYAGVCEFIKGRCVMQQYKHVGQQPFDYAITTYRGGILYDPTHTQWLEEGNLHMLPAYQDTDPTWRLEIGNKKKNAITVSKIQTKQ